MLFSSQLTFIFLVKSPLSTILIWFAEPVTVNPSLLLKAPASIVPVLRLLVVVEPASVTSCNVGVETFSANEAVVAYEAVVVVFGTVNVFEDGLYVIDFVVSPLSCSACEAPDDGLSFTNINGLSASVASP